MDEDFPDPDFSFVMGPTTEQLGQLGRDLHDDETTLQNHADDASGNARGHRADAAVGTVHTARKSTAAAGDLNTLSGTALSSARGAAQRYMDAVTNGPVPAQLTDVIGQKEIVSNAKKKMEYLGTSKSQQDYQDALNKLSTMRSIRQQAKETLEAQDRQIAGVARTAAATANAGAPDVPYSGPGYAPPAPAKPGGSGSGAPGGGGGGKAGAAGGKPGGGGGSSSDKSGTGTGKEQTGQGQGSGQQGAGQQPGQQPQGQQPQVQPQAGSPAGGKGGGGLSDPSHDSKNDHHSLGGPGMAGAVGGLGAGAAGAAAAKPAAAGMSKDGLQTNSNVNGRVNLAAAAPGGAAAAKQAAGGTPRGAGGGGMPMMPMMPNGGAAQPKRDQKRIVQDESNAELHGINAMADAVKGGTILRNEIDLSEPEKPGQ